MQLFSKRNLDRSSRYLYRTRPAPLNGDTLQEDEGKFISGLLRNRLKEAIKYAVSSGKYYRNFPLGE